MRGCDPIPTSMFSPPLVSHGHCHRASWFGLAMASIWFFSGVSARFLRGVSHRFPLEVVCEVVLSSSNFKNWTRRFDVTKSYIMRWCPVCSSRARLSPVLYTNNVTAFVLIQGGNQATALLTSSICKLCVALPAPETSFEDEW